MEETRYCDYCDEPLERKPTETKQNWEKRRFCDKVCAGMYTNERRKENGMACWRCPKCNSTNCDIDFCTNCGWEEGEL